MLSEGDRRSKSIRIGWIGSRRVWEAMRLSCVMSECSQPREAI